MDLQKFRRVAARNRGKLAGFLKKLDDIVPEDMPRLVKEEDQEMWQEVNCMECANCCKTMTPTFRKSDIVRIAAHLQMTPRQFSEKWLLKEEDTGDWVNKLQPCQFLIDNKCSIYEVRPKDCAEFPHHNKRPFDLYNDTFTNNLDKCPATFILVQRLKKRIEKDYEW
ncbi:MAG: YkgJ family cysteine cluster protein [Chitinophagaceae bacterium]|nr:MAG: YkgJ family cysteine cluster protein [Chitinophagaceae bacterium]